MNILKFKILFINPLTSPGEVASVFTSPNLSAGAPALGEAKGLKLIFGNFSIFQKKIMIELATNFY